MEIIAFTDTSVTINFDGRGAIEWEYYIEEQETGNKEQKVINSSQFTILGVLPRTY